MLSIKSYKLFRWLEKSVSECFFIRNITIVHIDKLRWVEVGFFLLRNNKTPTYSFQNTFNSPAIYRPLSSGGHGILTHKKATEL